MKKLLFFILIPFLGIAHDFTANGINYTITSSVAPFTASVTNNSRFSGDAVIPETVVYNSENYAVTTIARRAFKECSRLTSVTIGNSVTSIEYDAFKECKRLTSLTIGNAVTSIGDNAFKECKRLTTVNCHIRTPLIISSNVFKEVNRSNCALNIPAGTEAAYQAAAVWQDFSPISASLLSNHSFAIESALKIYPNPVSEILNIALQEGLQLEKVNFYNTLGQLIKTTNHSEINVSSFAKGNYFVEVMTNQGKATKTIIIQ
ncbi:leucine-rich repeat domain-containing protein [Flavobacterium psychrophilum]|uniref:leucine-rich repeat domain-containing protein n=1 Tax=Flavobacterium psychrophilum TaxID=96345 RepID=UPI00106C0707|nr:leucine-rich repeat domain-containing protein [Flavobacterium psychrophilum]